MSSSSIREPRLTELIKRMAFISQAKPYHLPYFNCKKPYYKKPTRYLGISLSGIYRSLTGEGRDLVIEKIKSIVEDCGNSIAGFQGSDYYHELEEEIIKMWKGIKVLAETTYSGDVPTTVELELQASQLEHWIPEDLKPNLGIPPH